MGEKVLCVERIIFEKHYQLNTLWWACPLDEIIKIIEECNPIYMYKQIAETSFDYKQIIPYLSTYKGKKE